MTDITRCYDTGATQAPARAASAVPTAVSAKWLAIVPSDANTMFVRHLGTHGGPGGSS